MLIKKAIRKQVSCLMLLVLYTGFLCFQVFYNLHIARNGSQLVWKASGNNTATILEGALEQGDPVTILSRTESAPSKRFCPKIASVVPEVFFIQALARYVACNRSCFAIPFAGPAFIPSYLQRGPPVFS